MENQVEQPKLETQESNSNLAEIFDILSGVGLVGGAVGSFLGNAAFAAIPLSFSLALQIANRRRLKVELSQMQQSSTMEMTQQFNNNHSNLLEQLQQLREVQKNKLNQQDQKFKTLVNELSNNMKNNEESIAILTIKHQEIHEFSHQLESQQKQVQTIVKTLENIENFSQMIRTNPEGAEAYYQRGLNHQKLGDKTGAIEDYTEALHLDSTHPKAYHNRGVLLADIGNKKQAVEDLRLAAKYYFEQGDIESYEQARNLSKEFYEVRYSLVSEATAETINSQEEMSEKMAPEQKDLVTVGGLFDDEIDSQENISILG
ncbi:MAG: tetratricopeptide repeat protein [Crocosphaera sp.]|nr:tetratricopeptide repeat protein [Crocosphaera sp.]